MKEITFIIRENKFSNNSLEILSLISCSLFVRKYRLSKYYFFLFSKFPISLRASLPSFNVFVVNHEMKIRMRSDNNMSDINVLPIFFW